MPQNVFLRLLDSRKFIVVLLGMMGVTVLAALGKIDGHAVADLLKWCVLSPITPLRVGMTS